MVGTEGDSLHTVVGDKWLERKERKKCLASQSSTVSYKFSFLQVTLWDRDSWDKPDVWSEEEGWKGPQLLKMAGLYSYWNSSEVRQGKCSYGCITLILGIAFLFLVEMS